MAEGATWDAVALRPAGLAPRNRRTRGLSAALAVLAHLALILLLIHQAHMAPRRASGGGGERLLRLLPWNGNLGATIHPNARRSPPRPAPPTPKPIPQATAPTLAPPVEAVPVPPREPTPPAPVEAPPLTQQEADEFKRQWAQLQGEATQQALDPARHAGLKQDLSEAHQPMLKFGPADADRRPEAPRRAPAEDNSMFAGELCVSRGGSNGEMVLALPCIGEGYVTDFGWTARVHAPARGEPVPGSLDPTGRVTVRNHAFSAETVAAFEEAQIQLRRIQVTLRMVYLPDLKAPIQLLSRDDRARAVSAQAFPDEHELAVYLREWAANVHRWMDHN